VVNRLMVGPPPGQQRRVVELFVGDHRQQRLRRVGRPPASAARSASRHRPANATSHRSAHTAIVIRPVRGPALAVLAERVPALAELTEAEGVPS